jgi:hypothetical protein
MADKLALKDDTFAKDFMDAFIMSMTMVITMAFFLPKMIGIFGSTQSLQAQSYTGAVDTRTLSLDSITRWLNLIGDPPYIAWIAADFFNDGPDKAYIGINTPGLWIELNNGESASVNMAGANTRIQAVFYRCDSGYTASVRVVGKY